MSVDTIGNYVRDRGLLQPRSVVEDVLALVVMVAAVGAVYVDMARKRAAGNRSEFRSVIRALEDMSAIATQACACCDVSTIEAMLRRDLKTVQRLCRDQGYYCFGNWPVHLLVRGPIPSIRSPMGRH